MRIENPLAVADKRGDRIEAVAGKHTAAENSAVVGRERVAFVILQVKPVDGERA